MSTETGGTMLSSTILDVAIGLMFIYLLLALICTTVNEWLAGMLKTRPKMLEMGITNLLQGQMIGGTQLLTAFADHPLIKGLRRDNAAPSYMAPRTFALALMDLITPQQPGAINFNDLETGINNLPPGDVKRSLLAVIQNTNRDIDEAQKAIEAWFNDTMDRVTGWYTRNKQKLTIVISVILTVFVNADTIGIANTLWVNPTLRQEIVSRASTSQATLKELVTAEYKDANPKPSKPEATKTTTPFPGTVQRLTDQLGDVTGWSNDSRRAGGDFAALALLVLGHIPGWILTIIAVSLGAPFWFDTLNRFVNIRAAGKKSPTKETSEEV
jgi:hypothetical protein